MDKKMNKINNCTHKERTISYALRVDIPKQKEFPEKLFKECCYYYNVLASTTSNDSEKNDFTGFFHQKQVNNETCEFVLINVLNNDEYPLNNNNYGVFSDFGSFEESPKLTTFILDWKKVLQDLGEGSYKVVKRIDIAGITSEIQYLVYNLYEYSTEIADKTIRIDGSFNGYFENLKTNFKSSEFKTSVRVGGFFGRREPVIEEDNLVNRNYIKRQISIKQDNEYKMQTDLIPDCLTDEIFDFLLLADDIKITDYNLNNHSYKFKLKPVVFANNEGTVYGSHTRKAQLNLTFTDKIINRIHRQ